MFLLDYIYVSYKYEKLYLFLGHHKQFGLICKYVVLVVYIICDNHVCVYFSLACKYVGLVIYMFVSS